MLKKLLKIAPLVFVLLITKSGFSQTDTAVLKGKWKANWISVPGETANGYGVYYFRKNIQLAAKPESFKVRISSDNRYKLYVNRVLVSLGPARGDTYYWNYETVDLAPYLTAGENCIAAVIWNDGEYRPEAQISIRTAFIMQGNTANEELINTNNTWKCIRDRGYQPITGIGYDTYYVAGPGEFVNMAASFKDWNTIKYSDTGWENGFKIDHGNPKGTVNATGWMLVPSPLPQMELKMQRIPLLRKVDGVAGVPASFPATKTAVTIPANTTATLLLDQTFLTNAYVTLNFSKGKNAVIQLCYAESLFANLHGPDGMVKGNRNEVEGKIFAGRRDSIIADGAQGQSFTTLAWRTYRYINLTVKTGGEPLTINDIYGTFTGYPFKQNSELQVSDPEMKKILEIGWRTARLCAGETYTDCPYYEQLQYVGDTRIQALISYYNSGDDRLVKNAINLMDHSRIAEGPTLSRHPSYSPQIITTFSLWYIGMLHDYWMYRPDAAFVKEKLAGVRDVLGFFNKYQQADGSVKGIPYWDFVDWVNSKGWDFGMPPKSAKGTSAIIDMQLMWAYEQAAEMETKMGMPAYAALFGKKAARLKATIQKKYWDAVRGLYADTEDKLLFSQHANSLAILSGMVSGAAAAALGDKLEADTSITQCSIYFKYYLHQALTKSGFGDHYIKWLAIWRQNIKMGLTTWAETSDLERVRSDCHAWGASPNIEFYRTVLGIDSYAPGFRLVKIEPRLGNIKKIGGEIPHPEGKVTVNYVQKAGRWSIYISLPKKTAGIFIWKGKRYPLKPGENRLFI